MKASFSSIYTIYDLLSNTICSTSGASRAWPLVPLFDKFDKHSISIAPRPFCKTHLPRHSCKAEKLEHMCVRVFELYMDRIAAFGATAMKGLAERVPARYARMGYEWSGHSRTPTVELVACATKAGL